eukprot:IDg9639t1
MHPDSMVIPKSPRFSLDIENIPQTNGKGNQEEYSNAVALWSALHDKLPDFEVLTEVKARFTCRKYGKIGHWDSDHNQDGTLILGVKSSSPNDNDGDSRKKSLTFNMAIISNNSCLYLITTDSIGALLDDGPPYSGIGLS